MKFYLSDLKKNHLLKKIYQLAKSKGFSVYLVGGCLRDCLLKREREYLDFDFALEANSLSFAKLVSRKLNAPFVLLDEPHGCARVIYREDKRMVNLDFSDFRAKSIEQDLGKRDFTINALALDLSAIFSRQAKQLEGLIIDPYAGKLDLEKKIIRQVGRSAFTEDPLRMLRAFSLSCRLDFKIEARTLCAIKRQGNLINSVSAERIREELFKILSAANSYAYILMIERAHLLEKIIPEIKPMFRLRQGGFHHLDVWGHSLETLKQFEAMMLKESFPFRKDLACYIKQEIAAGHCRNALIKFAAILHDLGKPATISVEKGKVHFYGHEHLGAKLAGDIAGRLKLSGKETRSLRLVIRWHLRPGYLSDILKLSQRAVFRYFRDCQEEAASIALLSLADQRATRGRLNISKDRLHHEKLIKSLIKKFFQKSKEAKPLRLLDGHEIMRHLKLEPGKIVGKILEELNEAQAEGSIRTKEQALSWAKSYLKQVKIGQHGL